VLTSDKRMTGQVSFFHLFDMELRVLLSPTHSLADKAFVTAQDLSQQVLLSYPLPASRQDLFRYFLDIADFKGRLRQVEQGSQILQLVAAGQGISVMPSWMAQPFQQQGFIVSKSLGAAGLWRPMYLACRLAEQNSDAITALTDSIRRFTPLA
jgi:LysR family transcriptional regulator, regulator for metE and metH